MQSPRHRRVRGPKHRMQTIARVRTTQTALGTHRVTEQRVVARQCFRHRLGVLLP
jgi:hypothetical protein